MASRDYPRLGIIEFGTQLIQSGDVDPIYVMLWEALQQYPEEFNPQQLKRWLVAYWCFYNAGLASYLSELEGEEFWNRMMIAAENKVPPPVGDRWKRGKERRHFRGKQATYCVEKLSAKYPEPEAMVDYLKGDISSSESFLSVANRAHKHYLFGHWIGFKIADMLERVMCAQISFDQASIFMFDDPEKSAFMLFEKQFPELVNKPGVKLKREAVLNAVVGYLQEKLGHLPAPPRFERNINIQEIETVLCKWKSHMNGHYPINNDIDEIHEGLTPWAGIGCMTAQILLMTLPGGAHGV